MEWRRKIFRYQPWLKWTLMDLIQRFDEADSERNRKTSVKKIENRKWYSAMRQTSIETFYQKKKRKESDRETSQKSRWSLFSQDFFVILFWKVRKKIPPATRITKNKEARTWRARETVTTNTSSPTGTVPLDSAGRQCYVGTY